MRTTREEQLAYVKQLCADVFRRHPHKHVDEHIADVMRESKGTVNPKDADMILRLMHAAADQGSRT